MKFSIASATETQQEKELIWSLKKKIGGVVALVVQEKGSCYTWHVFGVRESNGMGFLYNDIPGKLGLALTKGNGTITLTEEV